MNGRSVTAFAPASVANVGLGFDFMGFALSGAGDRVTVSLNGSTGDTTIIMSGEYGSLIPVEPAKNTASVAAIAFLKAKGYEGKGLKIELEKNLPLGSGMGSSASSSAAALFALNELLGNPSTTGELIPFAMEGERIACGTAHADNVAPSLLGGFVIIRSYDPLDIVRIKCPDELYCAVIHPHIQVRTADARRILKREIPLGDVTKQCANVAVFITGILREDYDLIGRSMDDLLAEPKRIQLIPGFDNAKKAAIGTGAIGCGISGSGPSIFALCRGEALSFKVAEAMKGSLMDSGLESDIFISSLNAQGAYLI
jgi:homoserine kinase